MYGFSSKNAGLYRLTGASLNFEPDLALRELVGVDKGITALMNERPGLLGHYSGVRVSSMISTLCPA
jgi:hypothetical protein